MNTAPQLGLDSNSQKSERTVQIKFIRSLWGMEQATLAAKLHMIKDGGFDGVEAGAPADAGQRQELHALLRDLDLLFVAQQWSEGPSPEQHAQSFETQYRRNAELHPILVNSHTGKDYFSTAENVVICRKAAALEQELGGMVVHEIHRGRMTFCTSATLALLREMPELKFAADFSHWCCVHESYLQDQAEAMRRAIAHSHHVHARVGFPEGPQVNDPRAPEWREAVDIHVQWWQRIVDIRKREGVKILTICPEFGPPDYMATLPYSRQPVADLWEVNCYMRDLLKARLKY